MKPILIALTSCLLLCAQAFAAAAERPNIIFIFADDWGWGDLSCHGQPWLTTPRPAGEAFRSAGFVQLAADAETKIVISNTGTEGFVILDAIQLIEAKE